VQELPTVNPSGEYTTVKFSAAILVVWLAGFLAMEAGPIWIPTAQIHFGMSSVTMGAIASIQFLASALMAMFVAPRLARKPLRPVLLLAVGTICGAAIVTAAFDLPFPLFVIARVVEGGASGICVACAAMLASRTKLPARSFGILQFSQILMNMAVYVSSTKLVVAYGLTGLYSLIAVATLIFFAVLRFSKPWVTLGLTRKVKASAADAPLPRLRILIACLGAAFVYCGFIALVANATALGQRASLDFAHITMVLAAGTQAAAAGALIATIFARRLPPFVFIIAASAGASFFGLLLTFTANDFASLVVALCGVIFFIYIGFPSIFGGIARLDPSGRSAAVAQATQMFGPALGPAVGAIIATHSVAALAFSSAAFIVLGTLAAGVATRPVNPRQRSVVDWSPVESKT
jgi:MFS family permease